ncbi:MAG: hypothetical protein B7O98_06290 [Zestosphaera tikiterensis]|uniref:THIF-type NAD/FAD binding fold domain-containing protein n=1 Tax=Zestosphaera tikiterensis TaxID=1973259 RepID=A0A2R7Y3Z1_9CREN|nr:MAG: hypothetical protein B7O98_06290 [Zestosphaera tikiterensis]
MAEVFERYLRQVEVLGFEGQEKLRRAKVVVVGVGGLGSVVSLYLTAAGVGELVLVDNGYLELSNLNRQILYNEEDLGKPKALTAAEKLSKLNSEVRVRGIQADVGSEEVVDEVRSATLVIDCLDNWRSRLILDKIAWDSKKPLIHGGISEFYGQVTTIVPEVTTCLKCLLGIDEKVREEKPPQVLGPTPGVVGAIEAMEAIKYLTGRGELLINKLLVIDLKRMEFTTLKIFGRENCTC